MNFFNASGEIAALYIWLYVVVFAFGITIGSFLNVCIYRLPVGESLTKKNSHCMTCGTPIKWYDLVPVFSWLILRGKCRACGEKISGRYILVESLTGILFVLTFMQFDPLEDGLIYPALICLFIAGLIVIGFEDFDTQTMTVGVLIYLLFMGVLTRILSVLTPNALRGCKTEVTDCIIGLFVVSVPFLIFGFVLTPIFYNLFVDEDRKEARRIKRELKKLDSSDSKERKKLEKALASHLSVIKASKPVFGFGMGDILLMAAGGLMLGWKAAVAAAFIAIILGAIFAVIIKKSQNDDSGKENSNAFAFGPFLSAGLVLASFFGTKLIDLYISFSTVPPVM